MKSHYKKSADLDNSKQENLFNDIVLSAAEEKIIIGILASNKDGITTTQLAEVAKVDRRRITQVRERLKTLEIIHYETIGRKTKYYNTELTKKLLSLESLIYSTELLNKLNPTDTGLIFSQYYSTKFRNSDVNEKLLFNFSLMVGIYILYISIQLMNPFLVEILLKSKTLDNSSGKSFKKSLQPIIKSSRIKNYLINKWLLNSIQPLKIFELLRSWLYLHVYDFPNVATEKMDTYTSFELYEKNFNDLIQTFERIFPVLFSEFEEISKKFQDYSNYWKEGIEHARCKHEYHLMYEHDYIIYECNKCFRKSRFIKKNKVKSKKIIELLNAKIKNTRCINNHDWFLYNLKRDITYEYFCPLCKRVAYIDVYDREKLDIIKEEILNLGVQFVPLLEEIEYFFHSNPNTYQTVSDFIQYYKSHGKGIVNKNDIRKKSREIFEILVKKKFIRKMCKSMDKNRKRKDDAYIRKSKIKFYQKESSSKVESFLVL